MSLVGSFDAYAEAFEVGVATRDWNGVAGLMADDVVLTLELPPPLGGTHVGRDNVIAAFRRSVDRFDAASTSAIHRRQNRRRKFQAASICPGTSPIRDRACRTSC